ncbi:hypothetical protein ACIBAC_42820 [Streptomyces sp. NPDC051362]|uniref:hypothetical protein n=1 Tax=Streptomyces sp. NPDC051362 TaxID=3365651 RepID=UPI003799D390
MPHTTDKKLSRELDRLLHLGRRPLAGPRHPVDATDPRQLAFQAMLFECLMSNREHPHPLDHPRKNPMASISGYLNAIVHQPGHLEIHTNTAYRIASRLLPIRHDHHGVCGIPGLRLIDYSCRRVRLVHLPTGARLDLVDWYRWQGTDIADMVWQQETGWHERNGRSPLWHHSGLTEEEAAHRTRWAYTPSTPLRSALLMRSMPLWYRHDLTPAWLPANATRPDQLVWDAHSVNDHSHIVDLLVHSAAHIPGATYRATTRRSGTLELGSSRAELISNL